MILYPEITQRFERRPDDIPPELEGMIVELTFGLDEEEETLPMYSSTKPPISPK